MKYEIGYTNDIGKQRQENQDRIFYGARVIDTTPYALICVADGMGGMTDGGRAAFICVEALEKWWEDFVNKGISLAADDFKASIYNLFYQANQDIISVSASQGMITGSTCTAVFVFGNHYLLFHVGDTRVYQILASKGQLLTTDHSLTDEQGAHSNQLVNFMGNPHNFCVDIYSGDILEGDIFLVCSDGFYKYLTEPLMFEAFSRCNNVQQGIDNLLAYIYQGDANDNISAVAFKMRQK